MKNVLVINFNVEHQSISRLDSFKPVENSKNYLVKLSEKDSCKIPEQVIKAKGFKLAVQGSVGKDASRGVITTEIIGVPEIKNAYFGGDGLKVLEPEECLKEI